MSGVVVDSEAGHVLVTGYDEAVAVLRDVDTFSNDHDLILEHHGRAIGWVNPGHVDVEEIYAGGLPNVETLHFLDPPEPRGSGGVSIVGSPPGRHRPTGSRWSRSSSTS